MSSNKQMQSVIRAGVLELKEGDTLVLYAEHRLDIKTVHVLQEELKKFAGDPPKFKTIVLEQGLRFAVIRECNVAKPKGPPMQVVRENGCLVREQEI